MMKPVKLAALAIVLATVEAHAADVQVGGQLSQRWCTGCHVIGNNAIKGQDAAPPLPPPAARAGGDQNWVRAWLANPHPPMPDLHLSRTEIDDITAYLSSLPPPK